MIREGILTSDRIDQLDPPSEVFYRRLMSKVDDHGLYDARPSILRSSLYPLRVDRVREADISRWIAACEKAGLIALYAHDGKPYLQMLDTRWQARSEPKYPLPNAGNRVVPSAAENSCAQLPATAPVVVDGDVVVDEGVTRDAARPPRSAAKARKTAISADFTTSERVSAWAAEKGYGQLPEHLDAFKRKAVAKGYAYVDWDAAFMEAIREDWAKLRGRGRDGVAPPAEARHHDTAEDTRRMLADKDRDTKPPPAHIRAQINEALRGKVLQ
ncbi:MAG: hypothetical protein K0S48_43 [Ramlibacter sp.]|jgi:hypothetical protein|nr:hypothetical protein [Ramlibacter sp.]